MPDGRKSIVFLELTRRCNLRCRHCYNGSRYPRRDELPASQLATLMDQLAEGGARQVILTGGEPLLHPELAVIVKRASSNGLNIILSTNGILLTQRLLDELHPYVMHWALSLDGMRERHEHIRGQGTFLPAVAAAARLRSVKAEFHVQTCVFPEDVGGIDDVISFVLGLGAKEVHVAPVFRCRPGGRGPAPWAPALLRELFKTCSQANARLAKDRRIRIHLQREGDLLAGKQFLTDPPIQFIASDGSMCAHSAFLAWDPPLLPIGRVPGHDSGHTYRANQSKAAELLRAAYDRCFRSVKSDGISFHEQHLYDLLMERYGAVVT